MKSNTKRKQQKQQKVSKKREFLRKVIESSVFLETNLDAHKMEEFLLEAVNELRESSSERSDDVEDECK